MREPSDRPLIAVAQYAPVKGSVEANRMRSVEWIAKAARQGAGLVVLPECCITGLVFESRAELMAIAESIEGPTIEAWTKAAAENDIIVIGGMAERDGAELYNAAVFVKPDGSVHRYRKTHVFGAERSLFDLGDRLVCVDTAWGRVGLAICYDLWFPEIARELALADAGLIAVPANWFVPPRQKDETGGQLPMGFHHAVSAACANEIAIACADRTGVENELPFLGQSFILGPTGRPLAGPASAGDDALLLARWEEPGVGRRQVQSHLQTRRGDLYARPVDILGR
jgi:predicted amidohydrolase